MEYSDDDHNNDTKSLRSEEERLASEIELIEKDLEKKNAELEGIQVLNESCENDMEYLQEKMQLLNKDALLANLSQEEMKKTAQALREALWRSDGFLALLERSSMWSLVGLSPKLVRVRFHEIDTDILFGYTLTEFISCLLAEFPLLCL